MIPKATLLVSINMYQAYVSMTVHCFFKRNGEG